jgi:N-acyl-D-amino-acid deacylase
MAYDIVIRGGTIVDGSGLPGYRADLGISDGMIAKIGDLKGESAKETIDAEGHIVSPGFVDGHTHMVAQIFWDPLGTCSCWNGVTSVVMGNCGFTLAPCAEKDKRLVFSNLERAEDISPAAMNAGIPWSWETIPEFLDTVAGLPKGINYAAYCGHSAVRTYVMGERAFTDKASPDDLAKMVKVVDAGMRAGALGLSTARSEQHRTAEGRPVASRVGDWSEVQALCQVLADFGTGVFEVSRGTGNLTEEERKQEWDRLHGLAVDQGVPITFGGSWNTRKHPDMWRYQFARVDECTAAGGKVLVQATSTWNGALRSFETMTPFDKRPVWSEVRKLPLEEQERAFRDPEMKKKLVEIASVHKQETNPLFHNVLLRPVDYDWIFPHYNPLPPYKSLAQLGQETGKHPAEVMIDLALEKHLKLFFMCPNFNEDQDYVLAMLRHPNTAVTFSDSGAHVTSTINPLHSYLLGHWVRDAQAITLEAAIRKVSFDIAAFWGLSKRGLLREGYHADVVVFDLNTIAPELPSLVHDLPTGAPRLMLKSKGIKETIVNGEVLMRNNVHTGALPGQLIRNRLVSN